jgi:hypothetical protein
MDTWRRDRAARGPWWYPAVLRVTVVALALSGPAVQGAQAQGAQAQGAQAQGAQAQGARAQGPSRPAAAPGVRYLALGDGVAYGLGLANPGTARRDGLAPDQGPSPLAWPSLIDKAVPGLAPLRVRPAGCALTGPHGLRYDQLAVSGAPVQVGKWTPKDADCPQGSTDLSQKAVTPDEIDAADLTADPPGLVTIQAGAADVDLTGCLEVLLKTPGKFGANSCVSRDSHGFRLTAQATAELKSVTSGLTKAIAQVVAAAPSAQVLLVGYYQAVPAPSAKLTGTSPVCESLRSASAGGTWRKNLSAAAGLLLAALNDAIKSAAKTSQNAAFVDLGKLFSGHELCTSHSWLFDGTAGNWREASPTSAGQAKIAGAIESDCRQFPGRCRGLLVGWNNATEIPGLAALTSGNAEPRAVSCGSAGNCAAVGLYATGIGKFQALVADEVGGTWQNAAEMPGTALLNISDDAVATSVSCPSAGNCAAGGYYTRNNTQNDPFVASEVNGTWKNALEVPGTSVLNTGGEADITSVSCASAGNCAAFGDYRNGTHHSEAFTVSEVSGNWQFAAELPGFGMLNADGEAQADAISCPTAGNCSAVGSYTDASGNVQAFAASEVNGTWQKAAELPGIGTLNAGGHVQLWSLSCPAAGDCGTGGYYTDGSGHQQAFVASEVNGTWSNAAELPGSAALNAGGDAGVISVSCPSAGNCTAGGYYADAGVRTQALVASESGGSWLTAVEVPGTATLNADGSAEVGAVSCTTAGNCTFGGSYMDIEGNTQAFTASELNGTWQSAEEVPGTATLNTGGIAVVVSVSCPTVTSCTEAGSYRNRLDFGLGFTASQS